MVRVQVLLAAAAASCLVASGDAWAPSAIFAGSAPGLRAAGRAGITNLQQGARFTPTTRAARVSPRMVAVAEAVPKVNMPKQAQKEWEVHKFGGASLNDVELYKTVGNLLIDEAKGRGDGAIPTMAIVSAMGGMTDQLIKVINSALKDFDAAKQALDDALDRQITTLKALAPPEITDPIEARIRNDAKDILSVVQSLRMLRTVPSVSIEVVTGFGEIWSAQTLYAYLKSQKAPTSWLDARDVLIVKSDGAGLGEKGSAATGGVDPLYGVTAEKFASWWKTETDENKFDELDYMTAAPIVVVTGFVASTSEGVPTTLKRSGSDFSATIFAKLMTAGRVTMWKNTDGVYTADPRRVPEAFSIPSLKYDEAMELAYFGAQVLHPSAMVPCIDNQIPVYIRNIFNRDFKGTVITGRSATLQDADQALKMRTSDKSEAATTAPVIPIKGITSIDKVSIVNLEGASLIGVPGVAQRFMAAMSSASINVLMITQASSEHSICVAVPHDQGEKAIAALRSNFELELARTTINSVSLVTDMAIVAIIGEGMAFSPGVAAKFLKALAQARVNVRAIAQGSSERQIAVVCNGADATRALRSVHSAFTLSDTVVSVAVLGATGAVGGLFLEQLQEQANQMATKLGIRVKVQIAASAGKMAYDEKLLGLDMATIKQKLGKDGDADPMDLDKLTQLITDDINPHRIVIDMTNSDTVAGYYEKWISAGVHVLGHNKNMGSGDLRRYKSLKSALRFATAQWHYEATVGAALPVFAMARDLIDTGDEVLEVTGCVSGTLAYILKTFNEDVSFSQAAKQALAMGYSHHNIARDLDGTNAARKLVLIARELGLEMNLEDIKVESLLSDGYDANVMPSAEEVAAAGVPAWQLQSNNVLDALESRNSGMMARLEKARANGNVLRHVSTIDVVNNKAHVRVEEVDNVHVLYRLKQNENLMSYRTKRYDTSPLICKGAAAGAELTASGVLADLLRLARSFT